MRPELRQILELVFVFLGLPLIALGLAYLLFKKPLEFLIDRILGTKMLVGKQSKTFRISFGGSGDNRGLTEVMAGKDAESQLFARRAQIPQLNVPPLLPSEREHYLEQWRQTEARFAEAPAEAVRQAHRLVEEVMQKQGHSNTIQELATLHADDISSVLGGLNNIFQRIQNVQAAARGIALANQHREASIEDLSQAIELYRGLFKKLLGESEGASHFT